MGPTGTFSFVEVRVKQPPKTLLLWVVVLVAFLSIWHFLSIENPPRPDISYSEFIALTKAPKDARHIDKVEIKDNVGIVSA